MKDIELVKRKIKDRGFITESKIRALFGDKKAKEIIKEIMEDIVFHEIAYTNRYISQYKLRKIYIFNPKKKRKKKRN